MKKKEDPQSKFQRLVRLLSRLQTTSGLTVAQLAGELETDKRNIQRDLEQLRTYNYPIESSRDIERIPRYWMAGQRQAASLLDLEETLALTMTVALGDASGLGSIARRGWDKLNYAVINGQERRAKNELPQMLSAQFGWSVSPATMESLSKALVEKYRLRIFYRNRDALEPQWRLIEPWQMFFQDRWYVRGLDCQKKEIRNFRPDRINDLQVLNERFEIPTSERKADPHFHKWDLGGGQPTRVHCQVSPALALWLRENPVHPSQQLQDSDFHLEVRDLDALIGWLLGLTNCRLVGPEIALEKLRARAAAWLA
ncbi:MAG: WYL domain-containing protein [Candidatus Eremiobacteraeota bacterium]|nr:WYL domain-containing protein [Candidatus Eremiobacteraeota bacterium]